MASGFHCVAHTLSKYKLTVMIKDLFIKLMKDKERCIRHAVMENVAIILKALHYSSPAADMLFAQLQPALMDYEVSTKHEWRNLQTFYLQLEKGAHYFTKEQIHTQLIPMVKRQLFEGPVPLKQTCAHVIVVLARKLACYAQQQYLFRSIANDLGRGKSFWHRMTYLDVCIELMNVFSRKFFKEHCLETAMNLSYDVVPNVRMKFCTLIPKLKTILSPSKDVQSIARLKERSSFLTLDKDVDVLAAAKLAVDQIHELELELARDNKYSNLARDDSADKTREAQELEWLEKEKEAEKNKRRIEIIGKPSTNASGAPRDRKKRFDLSSKKSTKRY
eukprot:CAMPEP_0117427074 /NCGR_PEP_ID=MMETSP0758-20121206/7018_1 /TAXON_ID=63605 /ORGANISM="Percolomonas cosmopolitus, Strain AE-1 (ATCC 50343)" /LENGTH=332 /DNA_ID=CAMNT_0005212539 /DNA_START=59 /DNA_END=1054 /DNA_ORIENTATION=-